MAEQEGTRMMATPSGKLAEVPYSRIQEAVNDGLEFTTHMVTPTGKTAWVPNSRLAEAQQDGLKGSGIPFPQSPYELQKSQEAMQNRPLTEKIGDALSSTFMSGGATDIRNMAAAIPGAAPAMSAMSGSAAVAKTAPKVAEEAAIAGEAVLPIVRNTLSNGRILVERAFGSTPEIAPKVAAVEPGAIEKLIKAGLSTGKWVTGTAGVGALLSNLPNIFGTGVSYQKDGSGK